MKLIFDLDGVIRDINGYLVSKYGMPYPTTWKFKHNGRDIFSLMRLDDRRGLVLSPPTEYYEVIKRLIKRPIIWTHQPASWKRLTESWIIKHFQEPSLYFMNPGEKIEQLRMHPDLWLVEDSPMLSDYKQIILIDRPYNKNVNCPIRIKSPKELESLISKGVTHA